MQRRYQRIIQNHYEEMKNYCSIFTDRLETEERFGTLARVVICDGHLNVVMDKFVKPRGGAIKNIDTKATGITREHIENLGEDFHSVREEAIEVMGEKVLIGHEISKNFLDLEFNPRDHKNNLIVDLAHNNFINFDLMVLNNYRDGIKR